jgi:ABC-type bacteriocin/lantibiotic exporter with double-glycine peptidase domain
LETSLQAPGEKSGAGQAAKYNQARRTPRLQLRTGNVKQSRAMCGPACLKIEFAHFGRRVSEKEIGKACRSSPQSGTTGTNLVKGAKQFGFSAKIFDRSNFRTIAKWLRRGVPVIVDWMSTVPTVGARQSMACGHYSVVSGLDKDHIVIQDPAVGARRRLSRRAFQSVWFDFRFVYPKSADDLIIRRLILVTPTAADQGRFGRMSGIRKGSVRSGLRC